MATKMVHLQIPEHVRFCEIGEPPAQRIFLDLRADRYFSLPPAADAAFSAVQKGYVGDLSPEAGVLVEAGLLVATAAGRPIIPTRHPEPRISLIEQTPLTRGANLRHVAEVLWLVLRARRAVQTRQLQSLLSRKPDRSAPTDSPPTESRDLAVLGFMRARRMAPVAPNCLYDSLALRHFLLRRSVSVDLVIGTKLHPFAAHCWLQDGTLVLNDTLSAARGFTPILVA
ncbi:MAG TPA: lasso peptide biosynthesis B2 protein [Allosphingosinicella sp.]|uniref:lasso peptide biosynthesis B2 protein n=1 Tax=Allosphingosinicella sp. TaxID=2823234 RepID=UPI002F2A285B